MEIRCRNKLSLLKFLRAEKKDPKFLEGWDLRTTMFEGYLRKILQSSRHLFLVFYAA